MREEQKAKIVEDLVKGKNILITGSYGLGKSTLAQELMHELACQEKFVVFYFPFPKPPKLILIKAIEKLCLRGLNPPSGWKFSSLYQLCEIIIKYINGSPFNLVLFLDEAQIITENAIQVYSELLNSGKVQFVLCGHSPAFDEKFSSLKFKYFFNAFTVYKIEPLSYSEAKTFLDSCLKERKLNLDENTKTKLLLQAGGNLANIIRGLDQISQGEEPNVYTSQNSTNLFPLFIFLIFVIIGLKYLYRGVGDYALANFSGFLGLVLFFIIRYFYFWRK